MKHAGERQQLNVTQKMEKISCEGHLRTNTLHSDIRREGGKEK